jgi:putative nucleotidyltransferase with HDIG domain
MQPFTPHQRRRGKRGSAIDAPHGFWGVLWERVSRADVLVRLGVCLAAAIALLLIVNGWSEPFPFRLGMVPPRGIAARVPFEKPDPERTRTAQDRAAALVPVVYAQDKAPIVRLRDGLKTRVAEIAAADELAAVSRTAWLEFAPEAAAALDALPAPAAGPSAEPPVAPEPPDDKSGGPGGTAAADPGEQKEDPAATARRKLIAEAEQAFQRFRARIDTKEKLTEVEKAIDHAFTEVDRKGVLEKIQHGLDEGSQTEIDVHPLGNPAELSRVQVFDVQLREAKLRLKDRFEEELGEGPFADRLFGWIEPRLSGSLEIDREATDRAKREAVEKTPRQFVRYAADDLLAEAGRPLTADSLLLLQREHEEFLRLQDARQSAARALAMLGLFLAMFALAGFYIHLHHRDLLADFGHVARLLGLALAAVLLCVLVSGEAWRAEVVPLLLFAMTVAIAYDEDLALLLAAQVALVVIVGLGQGLADYVTLTAAAAAMVFWTGRLRSRSKLIYVGLWAGVVTILTCLGANLLAGRSLVLDGGGLDMQLLAEAGRTGGWTVLAGFLMTGLLPFIERGFGVLTDLSLLEVGDVAHPLLQELVRRAPGTYNHSINVASLGEAAAEAIGARGLLVRVGAYFHDVGKMLKPSYFVENQGQENRHESLVPAMSTLIIVAHVKEGVELARQYALPQPIIDLIAEHHGTTLVEYFYRRATERSQADPHGAEVDEQTYRYPGPKPSTRESAVLMLTDAVESASRTLTEPTPARIASLVHDLAMKRLLDGQFDECGLTLEELGIIEQSLVKSLTAVYHGRVKYPDQRTA